MDSYSVQAVLSVKDKGFTSGMQNAASVLTNVDSATTKSAKSTGALGTAFAVANKVVSSACAAIRNSVADAVSRVDTLNRYPQIMQQMGFSADAAEASINKLSDGIQGLPTSLDAIVSSAQSIALVSGNLSEATDVALGLNNALLASGATTEQVTSATEQYNKMLSTGKVNSMSWMTLQQSMGYALKEVALQLGITSGNTQELYAAMQAGTITFDQFNTALIECSEAEGGFADMALTSSAGIATSWENVKTAVVRGVADMIEAWNEAAANNGIPTIQESLNGLKGLLDNVFGAASKVITVFVNNLNTIVAACVPVVAGITSLKVIQTVTKHFDDFKKKGEAAADALHNYANRAKDAEKASKNVKIAEEALKRATNENKKAQDDLFVATEKLTKAQNEQEQAQQKVDAITNGSTKTTKEQTAAEKELESATKAVAAAEKEKASAQKKAAQTSEAATAAEELAAAAYQQEASAVQGSTLKEIAHNAILAVMTTETTIATAAQEAFNAAMDANPVGLVIMAITALVSALTAVVSLMKKFTGETESARKRSKELKEEVDDLADAWDEERDAENDEIKTATQTASANKKLCRQIETLAQKTNKSASDIATLKSYISTLNANVDGLDLSYDDLTDSLNKSNIEMESQVDMAGALARCQAGQDAYNNSLLRQAEIEAQISAKTQELTALEETQVQAAQTGAIYGIRAKKDLQAAIEELEDERATEAAQQEALTNQMAANDAAYTAAYNAELEERNAALQRSVDNNTLAYDQLSEDNQALVDDLHDKWAGYVEDVIDGNNQLSDSFEGSAEDFTDTWLDAIENNIKVMDNWGNNMEELRNRCADLGIDDAVCDQLESMGIDGAPLVAAFVDSSDEQLLRMADDFKAAGEESGESLFQGIGSSNVPEAVQSLVTEADETLREQLDAADWYSAGESIPEGVAEGVIGGCEPLFESIRDMGDDVQGKTEKTFDGLENILYQSGVNAMAGLQKGLNSRRSAVISTANSIARSVSDTINNSLKVGSPSRVLDKTGKWAIQGLINGIKAMLNDVRSISGKVGDVVTNMAFGSFDSPKLAFEGGVEMSASYLFDSDGIMDKLDKLAAAFDEQHPIDVTVVSELDGREIAKGTAQYMQDEQDRLQARNDRRAQFSVGG